MANEIVALRAERDALVRAIDEHCVTALNTTFERGGDAKQAIHHLMFWSQGVGEYFAKQAIDDLTAERDALREDAARLDWLESRSSFLVHQWQGGGYTLTLPQPPIDGVRPPPIGVAGDAFRQAIDAAMAVQP